jgi:hypothetical protein
VLPVNVLPGLVGTGWRGSSDAAVGKDGHGSRPVGACAVGDEQHAYSVVVGTEDADLQRAAVGAVAASSAAVVLPGRGGGV